MREENLNIDNSILAHFTINLNPVTKKNSQQIIKINGSPRIIPSKKYKEYERNCKFFLKRLDINEPVNIRAIYYRQTKHTVDITNLHSALHDVLVTHGVISDDNYKIVKATDGSRVLFDKENPRTEVWIERFGS